MKTMAVLIIGFVCGLFAPDVINPNFPKMIVKWMGSPIVGGLDPLALAITALAFAGVYFARAKHKGGKS